MLNNLQENCPYYDKNKRVCCRKGCHLMQPCIAKTIRSDNYYSITEILKNAFELLTVK